MYVSLAISRWKELALVCSSRSRSSVAKASIGLLTACDREVANRPDNRTMSTPADRAWEYSLIVSTF